MLNFAPLDKLRNANPKVPIGILIAFIVLFLAAPQFGSGAASVIIGFLLIVGMIGLAIYVIKQIIDTKNQNNQIYLEFAEANNMNYAAENPAYSHGPGSLFTHGHSPRYTNIISGVRSDKLRFSVFHHAYETGSGKSRTTHNATVMRVQLPRVLPHMVIDSHAEGG
jgi:hypothetical protein